MRPLVFIDCETTGLDPARHELLEVAAIGVHPQTLEVETEVALKVCPERIDDADPEALRINGYRQEAWAAAVPLKEAMAQLVPMLDGAVLAGHNVGFDRGFLEAAFRQTKEGPPVWHHHLLDTATLCWPLLSSGTIASASLTEVCVHLGIARGEAHWALDDARASLAVARRLLPTLEVQASPAARRIHPDSRAQEPGCRPRRIYICHPYRNAPEAHAEQVTAICRTLSLSGHLPIAPALYLPHFVDEDADHAHARGLCLALLEVCDAMWVYGQTLTDGMQLEIEHAELRGLPVRFMDAERV